MSVVTEASCSSIIGVGNYSGGFQTGGNGSMSEREIEHPGVGMLSGSAVLLGFTATSLLLISCAQRGESQTEQRSCLLGKGLDASPHLVVSVGKPSILLLWVSLVCLMPILSLALAVLYREQSEFT